MSGVRFAWSALALVFGCAAGGAAGQDVPGDAADEGDAGAADDVAHEDRGEPEACVPTGTEACDGRDNDCDGLTDEGFDLLVDEANCGECGVLCAPAHAAGECLAGACSLACEPGWVDANGSAVDGCETACTPAATAEQAADGTCTDGADNDCDGRTDAADRDCSPCVPEFCNLIDDDCDGLTDEDYDLDFDLLNCGACGRDCPARPHAVPLCVLGDCDIRCQPAFADEDGSPFNGCEATCVPEDLPDETACDGVDDDCDGRTDEDHVPSSCGMGACLRESFCHRGVDVCEPRDPPAPVDATCDGIDDDCDGRTDDEGGCWCASDGDCDDRDPCTADFCGPDRRCRAAPAPDGGPCPGGVCCGGECVDPGTSLEHCGSCGALCDLPWAAESCVGGTCTLGACAPGRDNCDGDPANGCEQDLGSPTACGTSCALGLVDCTALPHVATAECRSGSCVPACAAGWGDCDGSPANGCETGFDDPAACGTTCAERIDCAALPNVAEAACSGGSCTIARCVDGYAECDDLVDDGCESALDNNHGTCGDDFLDVVCGDMGTDFFSATGWREEWKLVRVDECNPSVMYRLAVTITLDVPPGVDYDLGAVWGGSCASTSRTTSANPPGVDETVHLEWPDLGAGAGDSRDVYVEVRFVSGSALDCAGWTITARGNS